MILIGDGIVFILKAKDIVKDKGKYNEGQQFRTIHKYDFVDEY